VRGYDTFFAQQVKAVQHEPKELRALVRACLRKQVPVTRLAAWFGVSRSTVYNWMAGQTVPHPRYLAEMQRATALINAGDLL
jgi:DNA-binding transcriptional regulator YiaG